MRIKFFSLIAITCALTVVATSCDRRKGLLGSAENPIRFYFMPLKGEDVFKTYAPKLEQYIEVNTGLSIEPIYAKDFITIIKAFGKKKADVSFMNTLGYLMAHDWAKAEAYLQTLYGDVYRTYRGEIIVRADSDINNVKDLEGKAIAFADPFSASGYLYALKLLHDKKVTPKKTLFAGGHKKAVEMVYKGEVDAAATYHERPTEDGVQRDARIELIKQYPDIVSMVKIIALTDEIPNGPIAFSKSLPDDIKTRITGAVIGFARTPEGRVILDGLYNVTGLTMGDDAEYDGVRKTLKELGKSIDEVVPGGVTFYRSHAEAWLEY